MKVNYYSISDPNLDLKTNGLNDTDAETLLAHPLVAENYFSITTLRPHHNGKLYVGTTHMKNRILWSFDPETKTFDDLGYSRIGGQYDIKIHRSLEYDPARDVFYGVSSGLHTEAKYFDVPGSEIFEYNPKTGDITFLGRPLPHEYTQTITFDPVRRLLYGFTYHTFAFYVFDVDRRKTIFHALPGSISHISALDDTGCIWSTWGRNLHYIYKYDPALNAIEWTKKKFPEGGHSYMYPGAGPIDCMVNGKDGFLYVALETGTLVRMDPAHLEFESLGRPSPYPRMPALVLGQDGLLYGTCGDDGNVRVFCFDRKTQKYSILGELVSSSARCFRPHDLAILGNTIYVGETDNPDRTCYLWEMIL